MSWDDYDVNNDPDLDWDYIDYMNKTGIYEETEVEEDPEDELYLSGMDPMELEDMDDEVRRRKIEDAGLDPDDYDFVWARDGASSRTSTTRTTSSTRNTTTRPANSNGKWTIWEFIVVITIVSIIGYVAAAIGGELLGTLLVIIVFVVIMVNL